MPTHTFREDIREVIVSVASLGSDCSAGQRRLLAEGDVS